MQQVSRQATSSPAVIARLSCFRAFRWSGRSTWIKAASLSADDKQLKRLTGTGLDSDVSNPAIDLPVPRAPAGSHRVHGFKDLDQR